MQWKIPTGETKRARPDEVFAQHVGQDFDEICGLELRERRNTIREVSSTSDHVGVRHGPILVFLRSPQVSDSDGDLQSSRRTTFGSRCDARQAGTQQATAATSVMVATTPIIVVVSVGCTPNR